MYFNSTASAPQHLALWYVFIWDRFTLSKVSLNASNFFPFHNLIKYFNYLSKDLQNLSVLFGKKESQSEVCLRTNLRGLEIELVLSQGGHNFIHKMEEELNFKTIIRAAMNF